VIRSTALFRAWAAGSCVTLSLLAGCQSPRALGFRPSAAEESQVRQLAKAASKKAANNPSLNESTEDTVPVGAEDAAAKTDGIEQVAAEVPVHFNELSLPMLESLALQNNPSIRQSTAAATKAMGFRDQVGLAPNPNAGYSGSQLADRGTDQHTAYVEQDIVLGGKLQKNRLVLEQEVQAQLWEVQATRQRVLTDVRTKFYEALVAQKRIALSTEFAETTNKGIEAARLRLQALEGTRTELLQAEVQHTEVSLFRRRGELALRAAWSELFAVVGCPSSGPTSLVGTLEMDLIARDWEQTYGMVVDTSPEVRAACSRVARATANLDRQQVQPIPNLSVMIAAGRDNGTKSNMINTQVGMPIPVFNRNEGNISAAWAEYCRATQEMSRIKLSIRARLARTAQEYDSASLQVRTYGDEIVPRANEALKLAEQAYRAGETDFFQLLLVRRTYFDANLQYITAMGDYASANAMIDGLLLSGGLDETPDTWADDGLRGQTLSGQ